MKNPTVLKSGDQVGIVSTARYVCLEEIQDFVNVVIKWGLKPVFGKNLFEIENQYAGSDYMRTESIQIMLDDKNIKAIFCARGGYGTHRIIDDLNFNAFNVSPKWLVGFSDITVLHSHINKNSSVETLHALMPFSYYKMPENISLDYLYKALFVGKLNYSIPLGSYFRIGSAQGVIVGGNLSVLFSLNDTPSDMDYSDKILFIEDLDEYIYHIDRMIINFKRSGKLKNLKGLIVGSMNQMHDNNVPFGKNAYQIIMDAVKEYNYPVFMGFPAGHEEENYPLILGRNVKIEVLDKFYLDI